MMNRFPGFEDLKPPRPTLKDEEVSLAVATRMVTVLNLDDFYWLPEEVVRRILQMQIAIQEMPGKKIDGNLIRLLHERHGDWDFADLADHADHIGDDIQAEQLQKAVEIWKERYGVHE